MDFRQLGGSGFMVPDELAYRVVDAIDEVARETGKTVPQVALNWLLQRPTVSSVIIGARADSRVFVGRAPPAGPSPGVPGGTPPTRVVRTGDSGHRPGARAVPSPSRADPDRRPSR